MPKKRWYWTQSMDDLLRRWYNPAIRGRSQEIADRLKVPRWAVNHRAGELGLSRTKDRPWSPGEEAYVEANFHQASIKAMALKLGRSPTAVKLKAKRLGLRKYDDGYTSSSLAEALGVDPHWVLSRIRSGKLRASHRGTDRTTEQGGDFWLITDEAVIDYLASHPYDIELRKVDSLWFMDLIAPYLQRSAPASREVRAA